LPFLRSREDVEPTLLRKDGYVERWFSNVEPLPPTVEGVQEEAFIHTRVFDEAGREARADHEWTKTRGQRRKRLSKKKWK
jgi:hypothetical protein